MKKSCRRLVSALVVLLLALQTAPLPAVSGRAQAANAGIMPIAATETAVSSTELSEFNQYWTLGGSVVIHETVASSGGLGSEVSALPLYINGSSSYRTPVENPIKGNYGIQNKTTGLYWLAYQYSRQDSNPHLCSSKVSDNHLSMDYYQGFKNGDHVTMSYAAQGVNLYKDEYGRIFFKVYCYMADGGFPIQLYRAYFTKTDIQVLYTSSMSSYPDNDSYIHAKNPSVNAAAEALVTAYAGKTHTVEYNGQTQNHPVYAALAMSNGTVKLNLGSCGGKDVGEYPFYVSPNTGFTWSDGTTTPKFMKLVITKADPTGTLPDLTVNPYSETPYALTGGALTPTSGVTYTSSDPDVGTFENCSFVSKGKLGKTTVTAAFPGDKNLNAGTWTGTVVVALSGGLYVENAAGEKTVYTSLQEAYDALPAEGGTIHVLGNVTVDAGLVTTSGKNVTVVGEAGGDNGEVAPTLNRAGDFTTFTVENATLTLENLTVTAASGEAVNGGAVYVGTGGSLELGNGVQLTGNNASNKGGAVYVSAGAGTVTVNGVTVQNNEASFGNGIYLEDGATVTVAGSVRNLGDGIAIGYDESKTGTTNRGAVDVTTASALDAKLTVEFENPAAQLGGNNILYVKSETLTAAQLKSNLLVRNPGYTFGQETDGLSLTRADTIAAALQLSDGTWKDYADPQEAIDAASSEDTVYFAIYENLGNTSLNTEEVLLSKTLNIPEGKKITFSSVQKTVPASGDLTPQYDTVGPVTLKRADGNTEALVKVSEGAALTLGNITLDGGAVWDGGMTVKDDGFGGAGSVTTGNTGITAHAPVIVNAGTLNITDGATVENNDNNYASPGAGFGSQNYGGGVRNEAGGVLTMTGGTIRNCYSREGGGIMNVRKPDESGAYAGAQAPSVTVSGGEITGCVSQQKGAAIQTIYGGAQTAVTTGANITGCASLHDLGVLSVEEGGTLTVSGGTVTADTGKNALYLYNKYSAEDYASAVTKPFIEGVAVGALKVTGTPEITGSVHIDDSCVVYEKGTSFQACADLTGYTGTQKLTLDFTGGEKSFGPVAKWGTVAPDYTAPGPSGGTNVFYRETAEGATTTLSRSGYALEFTQTKANELDITGACDPSVTAFTVEAGGKTATLTLTDGVVSGTIEFDSTGTQTSFASTLKPTLNGAEQDFAGPTLNVLLYDSTTKTVTAPADAEYLTEAGTYAPFSGNNLPDDAALDAGDAAFKVGENVITVHMGEPEDAPAFDGEAVTLADVTDTSLTLDVLAAYQTLAFRLSYVDSAGTTAYTLWQTPTGGKLAFAGLTAATEYTVLARTPAKTDTMPSVAVPCPNGLFVTLTAAQNTAKAAFEAAYNTWKDGTAANPAAALAQYDALTETLSDTTPKEQMALDEVTTLESERLAELQAARDKQAADQWLADHLSTMEASVANTVPAGTKDAAGRALDAYNALLDGAKALVDEALANHQSGGASAPLPDPLAAYRSLTAAEIRAAAEPGLEDFCETYANAVQGAADKAAVDAAKDHFNDAIGPAKAAQTAYNSFMAADDLTPRAQTLAQQALEQTYDAIAAAENVAAMNDAVAALDDALDHAKNAGDAFRDYLDSREALTGQTVPVDAQTGLPTGADDAAREALDTAFALAEAADPAAMNGLLQEKVDALLDEAGQNGSSAVTKLVEDAKAAVQEAVTAADNNGTLADLSTLAQETKSKINAQKAAEQAAANAAALNAYKAAAEKQIEELAAQYDGTDMYEGAREELAALEASMLEKVQDVTLSGGLAAARQALDDLVAEAETAFAQKAAQGQAQQEYLDGAENLTGAAPDPAASPAKEALAAIGEAQDTAAMNDALLNALADAAEGLVDRENDSDAARALVDAVLEAMNEAAASAGEGEIAVLAPLTETLRDDLTAQRRSEVAQAQAEYLAAYNALTGESVTDLSDPAVKAAADAIGAAQNCAQANEALAKAVDAALEALKQPGDSAETTKAIDDLRQSVAAKAAGSGGQIASLAGLLGDIRSQLEDLRTPAPTDPTPTDPEPTDPAPTAPTPTDPEPTGPDLSEPPPSDPPDTGPGPTDPTPTDPLPTGPDTPPDPPSTGPQNGPGGDDAGRAAFDELKARLLAEAEKLLREHDGEHVRDILDRGADLLGAMEFEDSASGKSLDALRAAFENVERETRQAQRLQRFENSVKAAIAKAKATGRYDGEALDGLCGKYTALAAGVSAEGDDPQGDMDALYGQFTAELEDLRGPSPCLWWILIGLAALFAACVAVQLLYRRKSGRHEKTGR